MVSRSQAKTWVFSIVVCVVGALLCVAAAQLSPIADRPFVLGWPILVLAFAVAELKTVELEVRREAHVLTLAEIPLAIGLVFADPFSLVLGRVLGGVLGYMMRRPSSVKLVFNSGSFAVEAGLITLLFHTILGSGDPIEPIGWIAVMSAVAVGHTVGWVLVTVVMRLAGAPVTLRAASNVLLFSGPAALGETAIAVGATGALWRDGRSWVLLLLIGAVLGYFFLSFVRIKERHLALATLHQFTTSLAIDGGPDEILPIAARGIAELLGARRVVMIVPGHATPGIHLTYDAVKDSLYEQEAGSGLGLDQVLSITGGSRVSGSVKIDGNGRSTGSDSIAASLLLPGREGLVLVEGRLSRARGFDAEDVQLLETAVGQTAAALRNSQLLHELRHEADFRAHQALHDDVTDLPNQRALVEQLDGQLAVGTPVFMLTARIHSLREVNETLGRGVGDQMLREIAHRLRPLGRHSWCARSGTDEFTLVVPGGQAESDELAQRLVDAFDQPVSCDDVSLAVTVGVGVALAPQHGTEAEMLLRRASLAASRSALDGTTVTTWASDRDPYDPQRLTIAADLRDAIPGGELEVHFQPQLDVRTGMITSAEALVRWLHPRLGQLRPDQFIPAAENTGAIDALTLHVVEAAAVAGARWHARGWGLDIAVNLSARNLTSPNFADQIDAILRRAGLPANSLILELTESSVMTEAERALRTLHDLHELGVELSIDDFGTGYSSLAHLRRLPVREIKIDKSFVLDLTTNESDEAIVRSMIDLGHNLGLTVVVEGVETVEVRNRIQELGSDRMQGYLLSRPLPAPAFETWMSERRVRPLRADQRFGRVVTLDDRR